MFDSAAGIVSDEVISEMRAQRYKVRVALYGTAIIMIWHERGFGRIRPWTSPSPFPVAPHSCNWKSPAHSPAHRAGRTLGLHPQTQRLHFASITTRGSVRYFT